MTNPAAQNSDLDFFHPGARTTDPSTSHEADATVDHSARQAAILADVFQNGPGTEETILTRMGFRQRSDASSEISALVEDGHLVNLIDPRTRKPLKIRNTSGKRALVRGLPAHQNNHAIMDALLVQADSGTPTIKKSVKSMKHGPRRLPVLGCARCPVCKRRAR